MSKKYDFSTMPSENLMEVYHGLNMILSIFLGHYHALAYNSSTDVYYIGTAIEKFREIIKEAFDEISRRDSKSVEFSKET